MATLQRSTVVAVLNSRAGAEHAVDELQRAGFSRDAIGIVARDADGKPRAQMRESHETYAGEGAAVGAAAGAGVAALASLGMTFGAIPVVGPILAVGPLAAALLSAAGGAVAGGVVGALIGWGIAEEEAKYYESEVVAGRYLVTVQADGRYSEAWSILQRCGGYNRETAASAGNYATPTSGNANYAATGGMSSGERHIHLHEEHLQAHKQPVQAGEVRVRKEVVTEHKTMDVPVQRKEVVIERHAASGPQTSGADIQPGQEIRIPVNAEQVRVEK
jgi:stress response protein YsnF